jgi:hypothetical protein
MSSILLVASVVYIATQWQLWSIYLSISWYRNFYTKSQEEETLIQNRRRRHVPLLSEARHSFAVTNKIPASSDICQGCYADTKCLQTLSQTQCSSTNHSKETSVFCTVHYAPHLWKTSLGRRNLCWHTPNGGLRDQITPHAKMETSGRNEEVTRIKSFTSN